MKPVKVKFLRAQTFYFQPKFSPQNQFGYRDGGPVPTEGPVAAGAQACGNQEATGGLVPPLEDQRSNGNLHKKSRSQSGAEDSGGQRYSADPTIFLGDRMSRGDTDEDGYITPMKDKNSSGTQVKTENCFIICSHDCGIGAFIVDKLTFSFILSCVSTSHLMAHLQPKYDPFVDTPSSMSFSETSAAVFLQL